MSKLAAEQHLLAAAARFGDAAAAQQKALQAWKPGDPTINGKPQLDALWELRSAARAYATATRKARLKEPTQ